MKHRRAFLLFGIALLALTERSHAATDIALRERIVAASPVIRLADVAEISSADRRRVRQLSVLILMPAPAPGTERFLRRREVADLLTAHGEDLSQVRLDGAEQVQITTPMATPTEQSRRPGAASRTGQSMNRHAAILAAYADGNGGSAPLKAPDGVRHELPLVITRYLEEKTGRTGNWQVTCNVDARELSLLEEAIAPPTCQGGREPWTGPQRFELTVVTDKGAVKLPIYAKVTGPGATMVVAIRPVERGAIITAADVELQHMEASPTASGRRAPITSIEQLIGMEARQAIQAGEIIFNDKVQSPLLVKRGDIVTVVSQGGGIRVRTTARARQDGAKGELIQVESLETREQYDVRVTSHREAAVYAAARANFAPPATEQIETARR